MTHRSSGLFADHLEHAVAEALHRLRRANRPEMGGVGHQEGHDATPVQVIHQFEGLDLYLPADTGHAVVQVAAYAHHRTQSDLCWQVAEGTDPRRRRPARARRWRSRARRGSEPRPACRVRPRVRLLR